MANTPHTKKTLVACPTCSKQIEWNPENEFRPFCSERCKMIDLGAWASEEYKVVAEPSVDDYSSSFDDPESQEYQDRPLH